MVEPTELRNLAERWRSEAERLRRFEAHGQAAACEQLANELETALAEWDRTPLTVREAPVSTTMASTTPRRSRSMRTTLPGVADKRLVPEACFPVPVTPIISIASETLAVKCRASGMAWKDPWPTMRRRATPAPRLAIGLVRPRDGPTAATTSASTGRRRAEGPQDTKMCRPKR